MESKQATFYKTMAIPSLTYSSERWTPTNTKETNERNRRNEIS
jgi:hypothetical protein